MTGSDHEFAKKLTGYLDTGAAAVKPGVAYRLQCARTEALARLAEPQRAPALQMTPALAGAGGGRTGSGIGSGWRLPLRLFVAVLLALAAALGIHQWQAYQHLKDLEETDAAILSSDLPIDAYLDRGFQNWLKSGADD